MRTTGTINDILNHKGRHVSTISPDATVFEAIKLFNDKNIGALLVMEADRPVGIISERDYARKVLLKGKASPQTKVREIMFSPVIYVRPSNTVEEAMLLMTDKRIRHLPVMEEGKVAGVVSIGDLVNWVISTQERTISHLENYITGRYPG
ncbi:MAG: CBS domain-containing protein [Verrucomicrobia bacterium]|nr:CBS domain-containing protein [Verrucomicrobiota bacterium]MCF7709023.1 CBS domain-containing protein [Verrucomicrobiota bacterium]